MRDLSSLTHHPTSDKLVKILCNKTNNPNTLFFRVMVAYYFAKVASMMRVSIQTHDRGTIPVNCYAINLATSGQGKGHSTNIMEEHVINQFREEFLETTFPGVATVNLAKIAQRRALRDDKDPDDVIVQVEKEFNNLGALAFSFDSGTTAAVKQMRHKLLMAEAGSMNMEIDEIGSNLLGNIEVLNTFLELFDVGKIKQKLTKNTNENVRNEEIDGKTPTNMMLFGTPSKLLNGGKVEDEFISMLDAGYARRCIFGYLRDNTRNVELTAQEVYDMRTDTSSNGFLDDLSDDLRLLADPQNFNKRLTMTKDVALQVIEYHLHCEKIVNGLGEHEEILGFEISHRYFKALKLAGAFAFIDGLGEITEDMFYHAVALVEESGDAFKRLMARERNYVKLARYISEVNREVTHVDLVEDLPFYKGSLSQKQEMMTLATAWGYKNNIIIKKSYSDGIEFLRGESLNVTDLDKMRVAYSTDISHSYRNEVCRFEDLHKMTQTNGVHWVNHHLVDGHRAEEKITGAFNMVVIDCDGTVPMDTVKLLLSEYQFMIYTTKRHQTNGQDRFRLILPINYELTLEKPDYTEFMEAIYAWLPFEVDTSAKDRCRKWLSHNGHYEYNDGKLLDCLSFIPKTSKNEERKRVIDSQQSLNNLERWFMNNTGSGNRSNQLLRYALMLVDVGRDYESVKNAVMAFNNKLPESLDEVEISTTILVTASKAIIKRDA